VAPVATINAANSIERYIAPPLTKYVIKVFRISKCVKLHCGYKAIRTECKTPTIP